MNAIAASLFKVSVIIALSAIGLVIIGVVTLVVIVGWAQSEVDKRKEELGLDDQ